MAKTETVERATGRSQADWYGVLDRWGAAGRPYKEIAAFLTGQHGMSRWRAQKLIVEYEQERGLRAPGARRNGTFEVSATKTIKRVGGDGVQSRNGLPPATPLDGQRDSKVDGIGGAEGSSLRMSGRHLPRGDFHRTERPLKVRSDRDSRPSHRRTQSSVHEGELARPVDEPEDDLGRVGEAMDLNLAAVAASAIATQIASVAYYIPLTPQLAKLSTAYEEAPGTPPPGKLLLELVRNLVLATVVAGLASELGLTMLTEGLTLGIVLWIGFPLVLWTGAVMWEKIPTRLAAIHAGDWLAKLLIVAVIVTSWR